MNIAILGIGSIGAYISAMFATYTDHQLYLLARSNYPTILEQGIIVEEPAGCEILKTHRFTVVDDIRKMPACDLIILAVRESQLANLLPDLERICLNHTKIICLQNGINFEKSVQEALPTHHLYSGTCWIKASTLAQGHILHEFGNTIKLGRYAPADQKVLLNGSDDEVKSLFSEAQLVCDLEEKVESIQLTKLALNIPFFILMVKEGKTASEILHEDSLNQVREQLQNEIIEACLASGISINEGTLVTAIEHLRQMPVKPASNPEIFIESIKHDLTNQLEGLFNFLERASIDRGFRLDIRTFHWIVWDENVRMSGLTPKLDPLSFYIDLN